MDIRFENEDKKPRVKKVIKEIIIWVIEVILVVVLAYVLVHKGVVRTEMVGDAMNSTLQDGDKLIIDKISYRFKDPERFDIIDYTQNSEEHNYRTITRIIGLPGETIQIKEGRVYINDKLLKEDIVVEIMNNGGLAEDPIILDKNEYFVLGDNRNSSEDSRFANVGNLIAKDIIGRAWIQLEPFGFIHSFNHITKKKTETEEE